MENLVYIHLASAYQATAVSNPNPSPRVLKVSHRLNWQNFGSSVWINLLSLTLGVACLSISSQAMATVLRQGSKGPEVTELQQQLRQLGYFNRRATGNFGPLTKASVAKFQQEQGLNANGIVDDETLQALQDKTTGKEAFDNQASESSENATPTVSVSNRITLRKGSSGSTVKILQQLLTNASLYDGKINGVFDTKTAEAVKEFQRSSGLLVDGVVGKKTWSAIADGDTQTANQPFDNAPFTSQASPGESFGQVSIAPVLRVGDKGEQISQLQQQLKDLGYFKSRVTGAYGSVTKAAVIRFQQDKGLRPDGIVDSKTHAALKNTGSTADFDVSQLQQRLQEKGFYQGPINGNYDAQTKAAVKAAQNAYGIDEKDILKAKF